MEMEGLTHTLANRHFDCNASQSCLFTFTLCQFDKESAAVIQHLFFHLLLFFFHRHHQPKGNYVVGPLFSGTKSRLGKISKTQEQSPYRVLIWHHPRIVRDWSTILDVMQPLVAREKHIFPDWLKRGSWRFLAVSRWNWLQRGCCTNILLTVALVTIANCCNLL